MPGGTELGLQLVSSLAPRPSGRGVLVFEYILEGPWRAPKRVFGATVALLRVGNAAFFEPVTLFVRIGSFRVVPYHWWLCMP